MHPSDLRSGAIHKMHLTKDKHTAILCPPQHEVGRENPLPKGDNTPQSLAVFLCLSFFAHGQVHIMMVLFGQPLWLVVPLGDILTPFNTVANTVRSIGVGFILQTKGITAWKLKIQHKLQT